MSRRAQKLNRTRDIRAVMTADIQQICAGSVEPPDRDALQDELVRRAKLEWPRVTLADLRVHADAVLDRMTSSALDDQADEDVRAEHDRLTSAWIRRSVDQASGRAVSSDFVN